MVQLHISELLSNQPSTKGVRYNTSLSTDGGHSILCAFLRMDSVLHNFGRKKNLPN